MDISLSVSQRHVLGSARGPTLRPPFEFAASVKLASSGCIRSSSRLSGTTRAGYCAWDLGGTLSARGRCKHRPAAISKRPKQHEYAEPPFRQCLALSESSLQQLKCLHFRRSCLGNLMVAQSLEVLSRHLIERQSWSERSFCSSGRAWSPDVGPQRSADTLLGLPVFRYWCESATMLCAASLSCLRSHSRDPQTRRLRGHIPQSLGVTTFARTCCVPMLSKIHAKNCVYRCGRKYLRGQTARPPE